MHVTPGETLFLPQDTLKEVQPTLIDRLQQLYASKCSTEDFEVRDADENTKYSDLRMAEWVRSHEHEVSDYMYDGFEKPDLLVDSLVAHLPYILMIGDIGKGGDITGDEIGNDLAPMIYGLRFKNLPEGGFLHALADYPKYAADGYPNPQPITLSEKQIEYFQRKKLDPYTNTMADLFTEFHIKNLTDIISLLPLPLRLPTLLGASHHFSHEKYPEQLDELLKDTDIRAILLRTIALTEVLDKFDAFVVRSGRSPEVAEILTRNTIESNLAKLKRNADHAGEISKVYASALNLVLDHKDQSQPQLAP